MAKAVFAKVGNALVPMDEDGREILAALKPERQVMVQVHAPRNPRHHRLYFALLKKVIDGGAWKGDIDTLDESIRLECRHVRLQVNAFTGEVTEVAAPLNWESLSQEKFARYFDRAVWIICHHLLKGQDYESLRDEVIEAVDGPLLRRIAA